MHGVISPPWLRWAGLRRLLAIVFDTLAGSWRYQQPSFWSAGLLRLLASVVETKSRFMTLSALLYFEDPFTAFNRLSCWSKKPVHGVVSLPGCRWTGLRRSNILPPPHLLQWWGSNKSAGSTVIIIVLFLAKISLKSKHTNGAQYWYDTDQAGHPLQETVSHQYLQAFLLKR